MPQGQQQQQDPQVSQQQFGQPQAPDRANPDIARVLQPLPPPNPVVYGPPPLQQPMPRLANPLPTPPRDLYELSPYNTLLNLPQTTALLTAAYTQQGGLPPPNYGSRGRRSGGLLRALTGRGRKEEDVRFVPVFINGQPQPQHSSSNSTQQQSGAGPGVPEPPTGPAAFAGGQQPPVVLQDPSQPQFYTPEPTFGNEPFGAAPVGGPVRFSASSFPGFLNYSPHRILYNEQYYPSVMHLYEAMKYLPDNPVLAERIRLCPDVGGVHPLSEQLLREAPARHDWARVHLDYMTEAILHKFRQHPDLRAMLLGTGNAPLIYADEQDTFWGEGPGQSGENHLGRILETVREELRREGGLL
ncbi:hypothetical protein DFH07DRAFT_962785 [Mycena maculata]|uniref:NADAR domain-containing protein n=1 Tax=Mycena maculata TaxID=230809 RepID=A0AAD7IQ86_9AGAR|nr:hypothetical protein DFH07DRAFT_962785 [Mycena maculata]